MDRPATIHIRPGADRRYRAGRIVAQLDMQHFPGAALLKMCQRAHSNRPVQRDSYSQGYIDAVAEQIIDQKLREIDQQNPTQNPRNRRNAA